MAANNSPNYVKKGNLTANGGTTMVAGMVTATGDYTGVSANHVLAHTSGADGSYIKRIRFVATGTNTQSVARIYLNNGSTNTSAANNQFIGQVTLPGTTAINTAATSELDYPLDMMIPATFRIYIGLGTTVAASWVPTCIAGDY
jgi:hypothetical protein